MPEMPPTFRAHGMGSREARRKVIDRDRGSSRERGYTAEWSRQSRDYLKVNPLCAYCELNDVVEPSTCTDHLYPAKQYPDLFWVRDWWVASCHKCNTGFKMTVERKGKAAIDDLALRLGRKPFDGKSDATWSKPSDFG